MLTRFILLVLALSALSGCTSGRFSHTDDHADGRDTSGKAEPQLIPGSYFVLEKVVVRLGPSENAEVANTIYRQQRVDVYEVHNGWARISEFYDGAVEGAVGDVARWIPASSLSDERPADLPQPEISDDPRISGLPKVGEGGLAERDVQILHAAARYYLQMGKSEQVEYGDKSISRPGVYYLNFGKSSNHFFKPEDIPDLEERIRNLNR